MDQEIISFFENIHQSNSRINSTIADWSLSKTIPRMDERRQESGAIFWDSSGSRKTILWITIENYKRIDICISSFVWRRREFSSTWFEYLILKRFYHELSDIQLKKTQEHASSADMIESQILPILESLLVEVCTKKSIWCRQGMGSCGQGHGIDFFENAFRSR